MKAKDLVKARLWCLDQESWSFDFQFNPSSLSLERTSDPGDDSDTEGAFGSPPSYDGGSRDTLSFEVLVDTSMGGDIDLADATAFEAAMLSAISSLVGSPNEDSVLPLVHDFYRFTLPISPKPVGSDTRPPVIAFVWEAFEFMGFMTSFTSDFSLFDHNGRAKRATLNISMEGRAFSGGITRDIFLEGAFTEPTTTDGVGAQRSAGNDNRFDLSDAT